MEIIWLEYVICTVIICVPLYLSLAQPQAFVHTTQGLFVSAWIWVTINLYRNRRRSSVNGGKDIASSTTI